MGVPPWERFASAAGQGYAGEDVSQLDHGLQAAWWARHEGGSEALQIAALFHDLGHLVIPDAGDAARQGVDRRHERVGAKLLAEWYGPEVTEPVRLHVDAKRYMARSRTYRATLSEQSTHSLAVQGGPMSDEEANAFEASPHAQDALALRRWDDLAKDVDAMVPTLDDWVGLAQQLATGQPAP